MIEKLLTVSTVDDPRVPSRICSLLAQRGHAINSLQISRLSADSQWTIFLCVCLRDETELELLVKRLNRLSDVVKVAVVESADHQYRRSLFVRIRPTITQITHVGDIARQFAAEILDMTPDSAILHLCAAQDRCTLFLAVLDPYSVIDVAWGAVSGMRPGRSVSGPPAHLDDRQTCLR